MSPERKERLIAIGFWIIVAFVGVSVVFLYNQVTETLAEAVDMHRGPQDAIPSN